jgi:hypothetical protein
MNQIEVIVNTGEEQLLNFQTNLNVNSNNQNTESHRSYYEQEEEPYPTDKDNKDCQWKYYQVPTPKGTPKVNIIKKCNKHGRNTNDPADYVYGISMWNIHCIPKVIVDKRKPNSIIKCRKLIINRSNQLPTEFELYNDKQYTVDINGTTQTFIHRLLTPSDSYTCIELTNAITSIKSIEDCILGSTINPDFDTPFNDFPDENCGFEVAVGQEHAIQHCLYS